MSGDPIDLPIAFQLQDEGEPDRGGVLRPESILLEEFRHNNVLMYQHRESINTLFSLYLTMVSILVPGMAAAIYAIVAFKESNLLLVIGLFLTIMGIISFAFYAIFRNLRQAYRDSLRALGLIKEFYLDRLRPSMPDLQLAFYWRHSSLPRHALGGDSRVMNWTTRLVGSYSFGQAGWVFLIYIGDKFGLGDIYVLKLGAFTLLFILAYFAYPLLYKFLGHPPRVEDLPSPHDTADKPGGWRTRR